MRYHASAQPRRGFTLIELLVVIAIIAILASLLLPAMARAKESGRKTRCSANLHNMGLALIMYADDNSDFIPRGNFPLWWKLLASNLGTRDNDYARVAVYTCPSFPDRKQLVCYVDNAWQFSSLNDKTGTEITGLTKITKFQAPSETVYFADNENGPSRPVITATQNTDSELNDVWSPTHLPYSNNGKILNADRRVAKARHGQGPNLMYFDGHTSWKKAQLLTIDEWRERQH